MHATLRPRTNARLIGIMLVAALAIAYLFARPLLWVESGLGVVIGYCQLRALREAASLLIAADGALAVRRALKSSPWGKAFFGIFWIGSIAIIGVAAWFFGSGMVVGWLAGYLTMAVVRDLITLPGTFELVRLEKANSTRAQGE